MKVSLRSWPVLGLLVACGGGDSDERTDCERLQQVLCTRTSACAEAAGVSPPAQHAAFFQHCLRADLQCQQPIVGGDFELCAASLETLPCDYVVEVLRDDKLVSSSNCDEYIPL